MAGVPRKNIWFSLSVPKIKFDRVPTAPGKPGKMTSVFPVLEKYWNFIILLKILEKWEGTWKNEFSGKQNSFKLIVAHAFLLYRTLPIKMYIWEKFWDSWASVVFSDGSIYGAMGLVCSWIPRREIEPQLLVAPNVSSEACPHYIYH